MAGIIETIFASGSTLYGHVRSNSGQVWNGSAFEAYVGANWLTYKVALGEDGTSGYYKATFPATIASGRYNVIIYEQAGGAAAATDSPVGKDIYYWNGSALEATVKSVLADIKLDQLINTTSAGVDPTAGSFLDLIMNKDANQTFNQAVNSLEAIASNGGASPSAIADAVWDEVLDASHAVTSSAAQRIKDITTKLPAGSISGFDASVNGVNLTANQQGVTIGTVNNLGANAQANVLAQVVAGLFSTAMPELSTGAPPTTPTFAQALMLLFMAIRNKRIANDTYEQIHNAAGTVITKAQVSYDGSAVTKQAYEAP
jgi:hypothetical protein